MRKLILLVLSSCCAPSPPAPPAGPPAPITVDTPPPATTFPAVSPPSQTDDAPPFPPPPARVGQTPVGGPCDTASDCTTGVCEGEGCGRLEGKCVPYDRMCTRDLRAYCGCDGKTFMASGSCPGRRFSKRTQCDALGI